MAVEPVENTRARIEEALLHGELDAGVIWRSSMRLRHIACPPAGDEVPKNTMAFWAPQGLEPHVRFRSSSLEAVRSMVAYNRCITILGDVAYRPWSRESSKGEARPLRECLPVIDVVLVFKREAPHSPARVALKGRLRLTISPDGSRVRYVTG